MTSRSLSLLLVRVPLVLCLGSIAAASTRADDASDTLRDAIERLESATGYSFETMSEYHGGLGGSSTGKLGRPRSDIAGRVAKGHPVWLEFLGVEAYRGADGLHAGRVRGGKWFLVGERIVPRTRTALATITDTKTPHELLRIAMSELRRVTRTVNEVSGTSNWRIEVGPEASAMLAGDLGRQRGIQAVAAPIVPKVSKVEMVVVADKEGRIRSVDVELRVSAGDIKTSARRAVIYTVKKIGATEINEPPEVRELLGIETNAETPPSKNDGKDEE